MQERGPFMIIMLPRLFLDSRAMYMVDPNQHTSSNTITTFRSLSPSTKHVRGQRLNILCSMHQQQRLAEATE